MSMSKAFKLLLCAVTSLLLAQGASAQSCEPSKVAQKYPSLAGKTIKIGVDPESPPYAFRDSKDFNKIIGADADMEAMGYGSLEDFITHFWEGDFLKKDANNILSMMRSWQYADISANSLYQGDFDRALGSITARAIVMPGRTDLYFPPEDSEYEVSKMPNALLRPIESVWGHFAGGPAANPVDVKFIDDAVREILAM
ncbi:hypothetical protein [Paraburkholderia caledonica]